MNGRVTAIYEKNIKKQGFLANSAVYYLKPDIKNDVVLLDKNQRDISIDLLPKLLNKVIAVTLKGSFIDIGTPQDLIRAKNKSKKFAGVSND